MPLTTTTPTQLYCLCADWCGLCREYQTLLVQLAVARPGLEIHWVDIEDEAERLGDFDVETFPTLLIVQDGTLRFLGPVLPSETNLLQLLDRAGDWRVADAAALALLARLAA